MCDRGQWTGTMPASFLSVNLLDMTTRILTRAHFLLLAICFIGLQPASASVIFQPVSTNCDSLFLSNGSAVAVKNLSWDKNELTFSYCDDTTNVVRTAPWQQIRRIKKSDGTRVDSPYPAQEKWTPPVKSDLEKEVDLLNGIADFSIPAVFLGIGFILSIIVLIKSANLYKRIAGLPNEAYLRQRIRRARRIAKFGLFIWLLMALFLIGYAIYFFSLFNKM